MNPRITHAALSSPLVLDSPHSGTVYPADFGYACPFEQLRQAEDTLVDQLFAFGPALGATLIAAPFPRSYIDVNRAPEDIDPLLLAADEGHGLAPSVKSELGMGLVWRLLEGKEPIYAGPLTRAEVDSRIERCWRPYHAAVAAALDTAYARHGHTIYINCHSMPSHSRFYPAAHGHTMPFDFLIGDRDGSTAAPELAQRMATFLRDQGFVVGVNEIFKGVELVRRHAAPQAGRHAIQLEVNKKLYMDESRHAAHAGFAATQTVLQRLLEHVLATSACAE